VLSEVGSYDCVVLPYYVIVKIPATISFFCYTNPVNTKKAVKVLIFGILNFLARFIVGGVLFMGLKMNPTGWAFNIILTIAALAAAYLLLRFAMKPVNLTEALTIAAVWAVIALALDAITAQPIVGVPAAFLLSQVGTWTRSLVILVAAPFSLRQKEQPRL
jgi:hypothetical protein